MLTLNNFDIQTLPEVAFSEISGRSDLEQCC